LAEVGVQVAPEIEMALARALSKEPRDRYPSTSEFAKDLMLHHRRAHPTYTPAVLGALVAKLFEPELTRLSERLHAFENGEAEPIGWAGSSIGDASRQPESAADAAVEEPSPRPNTASPEPVLERGSRWAATAKLESQLRTVGGAAAPSRGAALGPSRDTPVEVDARLVAASLEAPPESATATERGGGTAATASPERVRGE